MLFRSISNLIQKAMAAVRGERIKTAQPLFPTPKPIDPATVDGIGPEEPAPLVSRWQKMMRLGRDRKITSPGIRSTSPRRKKPHLPRFKARYGNGGTC